MSIKIIVTISVHFRERSSNNKYVFGGGTTDNSRIILFDLVTSAPLTKKAGGEPWSYEKKAHVVKSVFRIDTTLLTL